MVILITSAAGQTGTRIIRNLVARGAQVRGYVRSQASGELVRRLGAEPVFGDLRDEAALARAMQGIRKVYHIAPSLSHREHEMGRGVIAAAQEARVGHFVLHGVMAPYLQHINYHWAKQLLQQDLYRSGLPYTVMLPTNYMQNVSWTWPLIAREGRWELPYSVDTRLTWVDLDDVAEAVANVLLEDGHEYGTYELCGRDAFLSRREIAEILGRAAGRNIVAVKSDVEAYLQHCRTQPFFSRMSDDELDQIRAMFEDYDRYGMPAGNPQVLSMLLGRPANDYATFARKLAFDGAGKASPALTTYGLPVS